MNTSYKGKILIATLDISGDVFSQSVVLIIDDQEHGTFGLILNKKNPKMTSNLLEILGFEIDVYEGGPVENHKIFFICKGIPITDNYTDLGDSFYITEDIDRIATALLEKKITLGDMKVFSGYSGWVSQQLAGEIKRKLWTVVESYYLDYTLPSDNNLWKNMMQNLGGEYLLWANAPENIALN